jgi:hypothetical protein
MQSEKIELKIPKEYERRTRVKKWKENEKLRKKSPFFNDLLSSGKSPNNKLSESENNINEAGTLNTHESEKEFKK